MPREHDDRRDELLMELVDAALELPPGDRERWLWQACPADPALLQEALTRVGWETEMAGFLTEPLLSLQCTPDLAPDQMLGPHLRIVREIAEGGMAAVYEAQDDRIGRVAVKVPKPVYRRRLLAEARHALQVTHFNICRVHGIETVRAECGEIEFLTMEYLEGETLQQRIRRMGPLPAAHLADLARQICAGLGESHRRGIVHGDLKGSNIIVTEGEGSVRCVITDFGLARARGSADAAVAASLRGTPDFLAPEIWDGGEFSISSDLYALGVLLYEAATGSRPFAEDPGRRKGTRLISCDRLRRGLARRWVRAIDGCLCFRPADRPAAASVVERAFMPYLSASRGTLALFGGLVFLAGGTGMAFHWDRPPVEQVRIAVLPMDADADSMAWGGGALRQASTRLASVRGPGGPVVMMPPLDNPGVNPEAEFRKTGATHFLRVRFRRVGATMRADLDIRSALTGADLKSFTGSYTTASIGALPEALVAAVTSALQLTSGRKESTIRPAAWSDYLRGTGELQRPEPDVDAAMEAFQSATRIDPESGLPWAGMTTAQELNYTLRNDPKMLDLANESLKEAIARDPDGIETHLAAGLVYRASGLPEKSAAEYTRVLQLEPGNVDATRRLAEDYADMQLGEQAVETWQQALSQLPQYYRTHLDLGQYYYYQARYEDAARQPPRQASASACKPPGCLRSRTGFACPPDLQCISRNALSGCRRNHKKVR